MATIEVVTKAEFIELFSEGEPPVKDAAGVILLASGAWHTDDQYCSRAEPPRDPGELLCYKRRYWTERLKLAEHNFRTAKSSFAQQVDHHERFPESCPPPPANCKDVLEELKAKVQLARKELDTLAKALGIPDREAAARQIERDRQQRLSRLKDQLNVDI